MIAIVARVLLTISESYHDHYLVRWRQGAENAGRAWHKIDALSWLVIDLLIGGGWGGSWLHALTFAFFGTALRLSLFALLLNKLNGHDYFHLGDNLVDRILGTLGETLALVARFVYLGAAIALLIIVWT